MSLCDKAEKGYKANRNISYEEKKKIIQDVEACHCPDCMVVMKATLYSVLKIDTAFADLIRIWRNLITLR